MKRSPRIVVWSLAAFATFVTIVGCAKLPTAPTSERGVYANPTFARVPASSVGTLSATSDGTLSGSGDIDGALGGEVRVGRFRAVVPPGAFHGMATITINVPDQTVVACELNISPPEANGFAVPVSLIADCQGVTNVNLANCGTLWFDENANVWRTVAGTIVDLNNLRVTASLHHFSDYGICDLLGKAGW